MKLIETNCFKQINLKEYTLTFLTIIAIIKFIFRLQINTL